MTIPSIPPPNIATFARLIDDKMYKKGLQEGRQEGVQQGRVAALRALIVFKFNLASLDAEHEAHLQGATPEAIDRYLQRVLIADSLAAVFDD